MTTNGEKNVVSMTSEDVNRLIEELKAADGDDSCDLIVSAITIEDALYLLATDSNYRVCCADSSTAGKVERSFYLMNDHNPRFCRWIVYKD